MNRPFSNSLIKCLCFIGLLLFSAACNSSGNTNSISQGQDTVTAPPGVIPPGSAPVGGVPTTVSTPTTVGPPCKSDATHYCLALRYTVYEDATGSPVVSQSDAVLDLATINQLWGKCNVAFQIENYDLENPTKSGLAFDTANTSDLDVIRKDFQDDVSMLVVTTGKWDRTGTLGDTAANAWTNMPGGNIFGSILEAPVGTYPNIIAHELGHYMNLVHVADMSNLMNPVIYTTSTSLTSSQCTTVTSAIDYFWQSMKR